MNNELKVLKEMFEQSGHLLVGFRSLADDEQYKVGDTARDSYEYDYENETSTYFTTGEETDGTAAIGGEIEWTEEDEEIATKLEEWKIEAETYGDDIVMLVGTEEGTYITKDEQEVRIRYAEVKIVYQEEIK